MSSVVICDSNDNVNMNRPKCLDGVALINAYVVHQYHSRNRCAGVTDVVYSVVWSGCTRECNLKCISSMYKE